jgi:protein dithiol oxidoreductase (disulfide-forming)
MIRQLLAAFCLVLSAGNASADLVEGRDYTTIVPHPAESGERVEVVEFFFYGCNSCYQLYPVMQTWVERRAQIIDFKRIPALRRTAWIPLSNLFYALQSLGALPRLHGRVYQAIHEQGLRLTSRNDQIDWAVEHGMDRVQFAAALESDETLIATQLARDATTAYGIRFTPSIVVDGRFLTTGEMIGNASRLFPLLDQLIEMALARRENATSQ